MVKHRIVRSWVRQAFARAVYRITSRVSTPEMRTPSITSSSVHSKHLLLRASRVSPRAARSSTFHLTARESRNSCRRVMKDVNGWSRCQQHGEGTGMGLPPKARTIEMTASMGGEATSRHGRPASVPTHKTHTANAAPVLHFR